LSDRVIIKKYNNRRLYDTESSKYITINQVAEMIKSMKEIKVVDANTDEDVTAYILTQIVLEEAKSKKALLPVPLLHMLIRYGDNILSEFFEKHLLKTIENYINQKSAFDEHFRKMLEFSTELSGVAQKTMAEMSPFKTFMNMFTYPSPPTEKNGKDSGGDE
jgi:polyhydroxyalkanoate synthesis repressor PhaR